MIGYVRVVLCDGVFAISHQRPAKMNDQLSCFIFLLISTKDSDGIGVEEKSMEKALS